MDIVYLFVIIIYIAGKRYLEDFDKLLLYVFLLLVAGCSGMALVDNIAMADYLASMMLVLLTLKVAELFLDTYWSSFGIKFKSDK